MIINDNDAFERICCEYYDGEKTYYDLREEILKNLIIISNLRKINENEGRDIVIDAPLLIEAGYNEFCDLVFYIKADEKSQIERICKRDNIDETAAKTRLSAQNNEEYSMKYADYMIVNDSLDKAVDEILEKIDNV